MDFTFLAPQSARVLSLLRIVAALAFMAHGLMKIFHFPVAQAGAPDPQPAGWKWWAAACWCLACSPGRWPS
jgi:uncharacterized membrane protein YphA (DoxX/SURF4 family)